MSRRAVSSRCAIVAVALGAAVSCKPAASPVLPRFSADGVTLDWLDADVTGGTVALSGGALRGTSDGGDVVLKMHWTVDGTQPARWWRQGWQSWSWSGVVDVPTNDDDPVAGGDGDAISVLQETANTSWEAAVLGRADGPSLHMGAQGATVGKVWLGVTADEVWLVWDHPAAGVLEPVFLTTGTDPNVLWQDWADQFDWPRPLGTPPTGWSDWYTYYGHATEDDILRNADAAAAMGLDLVQVDDGWEQAWGDWQANANFPDGTAGLASQITGRGLRAGIWMAPLLVDRSTPTYAAHTDWWVRDDAGVELTDSSCDCATLDVTQPDAAAWMQAQISARVAEGWTYLKLDFLYAGAREGVRADAVTGAQAYALATQLMRGAAGDDTWILACGAPMLPSVGFADSFRSGADIAFSTLPDPDRAFLRWQARNTAARGWANGRWWWNDADNLMLGADPTAAIAAQVASGGPWLYGEELSTVRAASQFPLTNLQSLRGVRYAPTDPLNYASGIDGSPVIERADPNDTVPTEWIGEDGTTVLLNVSDDSLTVDGPGGVEQITGERATAGTRTLSAGTGEVWRK